MLKVVFDTNIYISALHFHSSIPRKILELGISNAYRILVSKEILTEIRGVLRVKFKYELTKLELLEELLLTNFELVDPKERIHFVKKDPDDNKILECAIEGKADFIISGDKHLLAFGTYKGIKIITAREFWEITLP